MYHHSKIIILNSIKYGEKGRIVRAYSREFGKVSFVVNSVHSKRGTLRASMLLPLTLLDVVHSFKGKDSLERIKEAKMDLTYTAIPYDPVRNAVALFLAELFSETLHSGDPHPEKFDFVRASCLALDTLDPLPPFFHLAVWAKLSLFLGFAPNLEQEGVYFDMHNGTFAPEPPLLHAYMNEDTSAALRQLMVWDFESNLHIPKPLRKEIFTGLQQFYHIHLDSFGPLKSTEILAVLFA